MRIAKSKGVQAGLVFDGKQRAQDESTSQAWQQWAETVSRPIINALRSPDAYRRSSTSVYQVVELFALAPATILTILAGLLQDEDHPRLIQAVLSTLRAGKGFGLCRIGNTVEGDEIPLGSQVAAASQEASVRPYTTPCIVVPASLLIATGTSSVEELQIASFSLVVDARSSVAAITKEEYQVLGAFLEASFSSTHASGRGSLHSLFGKLFTRIAGHGQVAEREMAKIKDDAEAEKLLQREEHRANLQADRAFVISVKYMILQCLHPGAPYHTVIAALTFLELMLLSGMDPTYQKKQAEGEGSISKATFGKFDQSYSLGVSIIDARMVRISLSCADSTYEEIQGRALGMMHRFPAPLPGLEEPKDVEEALVIKAKTLLLSGRDSESTAAGSLLRLYQQVYIRRLKWTPASLLQSDRRKENGTAPTSYGDLSLLSDLLSFLEAQIVVAEQQGLYAAAQRSPLHGTLITLQKLLDDSTFWHVTTDVDNFHALVRAELVRGRSLVDRIWTVTRPILCAAAPEGGVGEEDGSGDTADTEVARALAAAEGGPDQVVTEAIVRKSQLMLSYAWRGMKEAAAFLGKAVSSPLRQDLKTAQAVWEGDEIEQVGQRFTMWMTAVRHRGAFSTIYPAYSSAAAAIVRCSWAEVNTMPRKWLQAFVTSITTTDTNISITRRSAGVGYAVLALMTAMPLRKDAAPLDEVIKQLIQAADEFLASEDSKTIASHVHSINILRVLSEDASLVEPMTPFIDSLLSLAIRRFQLPVWSVRNGGLMLFATLAPRAFPSKTTNEDEASSQLPANRFFQMYPSLYPSLREHLEKALQSGLHQATNRSDAEQAGSLYAVLFLLSRMQAVEHQEIGSDQADLTVLRKLVGKCLDSVDFKIREIASRAYASLTMSKEASQVAIGLLVGWKQATENLKHGCLLAIVRLTRLYGPQENIRPALVALASDVSMSSTAVVVAYRDAVAAMSLKNTATESSNKLDVVKLTSGQDTIEQLRSQLWDEAVDFQIRSEAADELFETFNEEAYLDTLKSSGSTIQEEWQRAALLTLESGRVPLRESVLTLLGRLTSSGVALEGSASWINNAIVLFCRLCSTCAQPAAHAQSRLSAAQALAAFGDVLFPTATKGEEAAIQKAMLSARVAVLDLIQDDDEEVRLIAAELVARVISPSLVGESNSSSHPSNDCKLNALMISAQQTIASGTISTQRAWAWMSRHYAAASCNLWTDYLQRLLLPPRRQVTEDLQEALEPKDVLFAQEWPNLYRDYEVDVFAAYQLLLKSSVKSDSLAKRQEENETGLRRLSTNSKSLHGRAGRLIGVRLCLAADLLLRQSPEEELSSLKEVKEETMRLLNLES